MREMVLNHASLASCAPVEAVPWLVDVAAGMSALIASGVAESSLRMRAPDPGGFSIHDSYQELRRRGERDPYVFLLKLSTKSPLLDGVAEGTADRFRACEALGCATKKLRPEDGEPLVLCAISDAIAVGSPSEPVWDRDQLTVRFQELLPDDLDASAAPWLSGPVPDWNCDSQAGGTDGHDHAQVARGASFRFPYRPSRSVRVPHELRQGWEDPPTR